MNIELYKYGIEQSLNTAVRLLRGVIGTNLSKKDKDLQIKEAIGIIDTLQRLIIVNTGAEDEVENE